MRYGIWEVGYFSSDSCNPSERRIIVIMNGKFVRLSFIVQIRNGRIYLPFEALGIVVPDAVISSIYSHMRKL